MLNPIAHVFKGELDRTHALDEHLLGVAKLASHFAADFDAGQWCYLAGLWHDLGKYSKDFQQYIRSASGFESHLVDDIPGKVNHSTAGALQAIKAFGNAGLPLAYLIAGHHAGLADWAGDRAGASSLANRMSGEESEHLLQKALAALPEDHILKAELPAFQPASFGHIKGLPLWIRMLFS